MPYVWQPRGVVVTSLYFGMQRTHFHWFYTQEDFLHNALHTDYLHAIFSAPQSLRYLWRRPTKPLPSLPSLSLESHGPHKSVEWASWPFTQASASRLPWFWCLSTHLPLLRQWHLRVSFEPSGWRLNALLVPDRRPQEKSENKPARWRGAPA